MPIRRSTLPVPREGNKVTLYHDGGACLEAMYQAIISAQREILLEMYWFGSDKTGQRFAQALEERARAGVRVSVIYDAVGSWESDSAQFERLRAAGCHVREYNPVRRWLFRFGAGNRRDHRKLLVVDGRIGMTGGVNLADPWAPIADGGGGFRDNLVRIEGPAVADMRAIFASVWRSKLPAMTTPRFAGEVSVRVLANDRRKQRRRIERAYLQAIRAAQRRVLIENSYFVPSWLVRAALRRAAKRGVDVNVVLPALSDVPLVQFASRRSYDHLLQAGVKVYEWGQSVLHSKIAVVDDWCTVGTHNLDYRSWLYNLEINVSMVDPRLSRELSERIQQAIVVSKRVDPKKWAVRPLLQRWLEKLMYRFRRLL